EVAVAVEGHFIDPEEARGIRDPRKLEELERHRPAAAVLLGAPESRHRLDGLAEQLLHLAACAPDELRRRQPLSALSHGDGRGARAPPLRRLPRRSRPARAPPRRPRAPRGSGPGRAAAPPPHPRPARTPRRARGPARAEG